jgi:hypothetical protein
MTEGQERLRAAQERFDRARKAVTDHVGRATVLDSGEHVPAGPPSDEKWGDDLDRLERELKEAGADLIVAGRHTADN